MIEKRTGNLVLDDGTILGPTTKRDDFLKTQLGTQSRELVKNPPWCSFKLHKVKIDGKEFAIVIYFHGQDLTMIHLAMSDPKWGTSWNDWSEEKERDREKAHDDWLRKTLGRQRQYPWGEVWSGYDQKSGGSSIRIDYQQE